MEPHSVEPSFDSLLDKVDLPRKLNISRVELQEFSDDPIVEKVTSHGSLPSREAFQTSEIVIECGRVYGLDHDLALKELPRFIAKVAHGFQYSPMNVGRAEMERRDAQNRFDHEVSTHTLSALVDRLGQDAVSVLVAGLASEIKDLRVKIIDVLRLSKIFPTPVVSAAVRRLAIILSEDKQHSERLERFVEKINSINEFEEVSQVEHERLVGEFKSLYGESEDLGSSLLDEKTSIFRYLKEAGPELNQYFAVLLDCSEFISFCVDTVSQDLLDLKYLLSEILERDSDNIGLILQGLESEKPEYKAIALEVIESAPNIFKNHADSIQPLLKDFTVYVGLGAVTALGSLGHAASAAGPELLAIAKSDNLELRNAAMGVLGHVRAPQEEAMEFLLGQWETFKQSHDDSQFDIGREGARRSRESIFAYAVHLYRQIRGDERSDVSEAPRVPLGSVLISVGQYLSSDVRAVRIFDEAISMRSRIVREELVNSMSEVKDFDAIAPYLAKAIRTQAGGHRLAVLAYRYGKEGENLMKDYRSEVKAMAAMCPDKQEEERYTNLLSKIDQAIAQAEAVAKYHRDNNTGQFFKKTATT